MKKYLCTLDMPRNDAQRVATIKALRTLLGLGLRDAKHLSDIVQAQVRRDDRDTLLRDVVLNGEQLLNLLLPGATVNTYNYGTGEYDEDPAGMWVSVVSAVPMDTPRYIDISGSN